jgi:hypothetical protein
LLPAGPYVTKEMPAPLPAPSLTGNEETCRHVTPWSLLRHRPFLRVPSSRVPLSAGLIASRSPAPRPSSLPPILKGRFVRLKVRPRSVERRIAPLPAHSLV